MIKRFFSESTIRNRTQHDAFVLMIRNSLRDNSKWETIDVLSYWFAEAFGREITSGDVERGLVDRIRIQLLKNGGVNDPILTENMYTRVIAHELEID